MKSSLRKVSKPIGASIDATYNNTKLGDFKEFEEETEKAEELRKKSRRVLKDEL